MQHNHNHNQQQPSPALSSPSAGFFAARASPLFSQSSEQVDPTLNVDTSSSLLNPSSSPAASNTVKVGGGGGGRRRRRRDGHADGDSDGDDDGPKAPPKQLSQGMECLSHALKVIAEIRLGSDILLEALERATDLKSQQISSSDSSIKQASDLVVRTTDAVATSFEELRATGKFIYSASGTFKHEIKEEQGQF